ncbi:MAG TPA: cytochrome c oxidase assembly protein [Gammaproteobacteria bacterium]|nr:cytochrome c oxidase assembly protein [Gammaproteobacteria bacterium]
MVQNTIRKHLLIMTIIVIGMFAFCFALVPLYNVLCTLTGLNGKTSPNEVLMPQVNIDTSRYVNVELLATRNGNLSANFYPQTKKFRVHPGEFIDTAFWVENLESKPLVLQAIPSVAPGLAAEHIKKQVCFCFQHQELEGNQRMKMPLRFMVDSKLPKKYTTITLAYTLFDVTS